MIEIELPKGLEDRLAALAERKGRTKDYYARKAVIELIEDMEDVESALESLKEPGRTWTIEEVETELGLAN